MFLICDTAFPACINGSAALLFAVVVEDLFNREDAPARVGEVAVTEALFVKARRAEVKTRRSPMELTKYLPDDSTNSGVELYFSMSGLMVSYNIVD